jgi:hypothetical protein
MNAAKSATSARLNEAMILIPVVARSNAVIDGLFDIDDAAVAEKPLLVGEIWRPMCLVAMQPRAVTRGAVLVQSGDGTSGCISQQCGIQGSGFRPGFEQSPFHVGTP